MSDVFAVLFPPEFVNALLGVLALVILDLVFGISVALKSKVFKWSELANFYTTSVLPNLFGWAVADVVIRLAALRGLPIISDSSN